MSVPNPSPHQDADGVREFFNQWHLYQKVVGCNYLHHREAYAALAEALDRFDRPFHFLDLGSGDAQWTSQVLAGRPVRRYEAVDLSPVALGLAEKNAAQIGGEQIFTTGDFSEVLRANGTSHDVIFIGLSLHHLPHRDKEAFLPVVRDHLKPGGSFLCYEPINEPGETRDAVLDRWWKLVLTEWTELTEEELRAVHDHVFGNDYPESCEDFEAMAGAAGLSRTRVLYRDPEKLYAVIECRE